MWEVVQAKAYHVGRVVRNLRHEHAAYMDRMGMDAHRELRRAFMDSSWSRTWMRDDVPVAIGGVSGSLLSPAGYVWLALTEGVTRFPFQIVREARRQIAAMMETRTEIQSLAVLCDPTAWRFAMALGFCAKTPDGSFSLTPQSRKTSAQDILRARPEFLMQMPGYGDGVLISFGGEK